MGYDEFKEKFVEDVKERIADKGLTADVRTVEKVNETYEALSVTPEGGNIGMNLNIDRFYSSYEDGVDYEDLVNNAMNVIDRGISNIPDLDVNKFTDYEQMKDKLVMEVVSAETNAAILATIPHKNMEDMAIVYRFMLNNHNGEQASILVTNTILAQMGITPEQLHADALKNAPEVKPLVIQGIPCILDMVDKKVLAIVTAVEISYLDPPVQEMLYEYMMENDICKAFQLYAVRDYLKDHETITKMELMRILNENAPKDESNRFQQLTITKKKLQEYFPPFYTKSQMEKILFKLLEDWKKENEKENT